MQNDTPTPSPSTPLTLRERPRRLRRTAALRATLAQTHLRAEDLIQPLFVQAFERGNQPIPSLPGQWRYSLDTLPGAVEALARLGIRAVALFPVLDPQLKDVLGSAALREDALVLQAVRTVKATVPELIVLTDIALDPYTSHGHDGVLTPDGSDVDNDATVALLAQMAVLHARAGVDGVAPSDMMDGRVGAIRAQLDAAGLTQTLILAYTAKFDSAYYGPFREAVGSAAAAGTRLLGKGTYQLPPANPRDARREARLDAAEGADLLMVKPAGPYLDILSQLRGVTDLPLAAYQVSGEYAQLHAAARVGWLDLARCRDESLLGIKRAGADWILTYFAADCARDWRGEAADTPAIAEAEVEDAQDYAPGEGI